MTFCINNVHDAFIPNSWIRDNREWLKADLYMRWFWVNFFSRLDYIINQWRFYIFTGNTLEFIRLYEFIHILVFIILFFFIGWLSMSILLILIYLRFFWRGNKNLYRKLPWQILREFVFDRLIPLHDDTARVMNICKLSLNHIINYIIKCRLWNSIAHEPRLESTVQWDAFLYFNIHRNTCNCYATLDSILLPWNCFSKDLYRYVSLEPYFSFQL